MRYEQGWGRETWRQQVPHDMSVRSASERRCSSKCRDVDHISADRTYGVPLRREDFPFDDPDRDVHPGKGHLQLAFARERRARVEVDERNLIAAGGAEAGTQQRNTYPVRTEDRLGCFPRNVNGDPRGWNPVQRGGITFLSARAAPALHGRTFTDVLVLALSGAALRDK